MVGWAECLWQMVTHYRDTAADWLGGTGGKHTWCWQVCQILPVRGAAPDAHDFSRADLGISGIYFEVRRDRKSKFPCYGMVGGKRSKMNTRDAPNASKISKHVCISFFYGTQKNIWRMYWLTLTLWTKKSRKTKKAFRPLRRKQLNHFQKDKNAF